MQGTSLFQINTSSLVPLVAKNEWVAVTPVTEAPPDQSICFFRCPKTAELVPRILKYAEGRVFAISIGETSESFLVDSVWDVVYLVVGTACVVGIDWEVAKRRH